MPQTFDYDVIIVGSGLGGSVSALRLSEAGFRVALLEQGRDYQAQDFVRSGQSTRHLLWAPALKLTGPLAQEVFRHVGVVRGIGVGGGSLVYAAVLLKPGTTFYQDRAWAHLSPDWQAEPAPHYQRAQQMLGLSENPYRSLQDHWLEQTAARLGVADSYSSVLQGIYFDDPALPPHDPFFNGHAPCAAAARAAASASPAAHTGPRTAYRATTCSWPDRQAPKCLPKPGSLISNPGPAVTACIAGIRCRDSNRRH